MIYLMSDLHGQYEKYRRMLELINFSDNDILYILGDIVDRGNGGIEILRDVIKRKNVVALMGNHDWTMLTLIRDEKLLIKKMGRDNALVLYRLWFSDGGRPTYKAFYSLEPAERRKILEYVSYLNYLTSVTVNGKKYYLSHTLPEYNPNITLENQNAEEFIQGDPDYDKAYMQDAFTVTGHTPTKLIDKNYKGRIWQGNRHIAIDCGTGFGENLGCLRLDTMKEYYV